MYIYKGMKAPSYLLIGRAAEVSTDGRTSLAIGKSKLTKSRGGKGEVPLLIRRHVGEEACIPCIISTCLSNQLIEAAQNERMNNNATQFVSTGKCFITSLTGKTSIIIIITMHLV